VWVNSTGKYEGLPPVTVVPGGRRVALTGLRGGAVTMLETTRLALDALRGAEAAQLSHFARRSLAVTTLVVG